VIYLPRIGLEITASASAIASACLDYITLAVSGETIGEVAVFIRDCCQLRRGKPL